MKTNQFKAELKLLDLTQADLAVLFGVTSKTINTAINSDKIPALYIYAIQGVKLELKGDL